LSTIHRQPVSGYTQPLLAYVAPEMVAGYGASLGSSIGPPADVFSLAVVVSELLAPSHKPLLGHVRHSLNEYKAAVVALQHAGVGAPDPLAGVPPAIQGAGAHAKRDAVWLPGAGSYCEQPALRGVRGCAGRPDVSWPTRDAYSESQRNGWRS
jgi:hypothetical protein